MEKQNIRITLRMSETLYNLLTQSAGLVDRPLNTEIIRRLESTFAEYSNKSKFGFIENIKDLANFEGLTEAQERRVLELIAQALQQHLTPKNTTP